MGSGPLHVSEHAGAAFCEASKQRAPHPLATPRLCSQPAWRRLTRRFTYFACHGVSHASRLGRCGRRPQPEPPFLDRVPATLGLPGWFGPSVVAESEPRRNAHGACKWDRCRAGVGELLAESREYLDRSADRTATASVCSDSDAEAIALVDSGTVESRASRSVDRASTFCVAWGRPEYSRPSCGASRSRAALGGQCWPCRRVDARSCRAGTDVAEGSSISISSMINNDWLGIGSGCYLTRPRHSEAYLELLAPWRSKGARAHPSTQRFTDVRRHPAPSGSLLACRHAVPASGAAMISSGFALARFTATFRR